MTDTPTFSVVIPAYNAGRTIRSALTSVLTQTRQDFEVIVVDDGCTDDTVDRVQGMNDRRITVVSQPNAGTSAALNTGIAHARGELISVLGADDLYLPIYLHQMARALAEAPEAGYAYTDAWSVDDRTRRIHRDTAMAHAAPPQPPPTDPQRFLVELLRRNFVLGLATIRRSVLAVVGSFDTAVKQSEDYELWLRMAAHGYPGVRARGVLAIYRRRQDSKTADLVRAASALTDIYRLVEEEYDVPESVRRIARQRRDETAAQLAVFRASRARRRFVPKGARRLVGRCYRAIRYRSNWYATPPSRLAAFLQDVEAFRP